MNCPVCKIPMMIVEHESLELDCCTRCHGIWLDAGELELLLGDDPAANVLAAASVETAAGAKSARRCPACGRHMREATTGGKAAVTYDRCPRRDGLWFDEGELQTILRDHAAAPGGAQLGEWIYSLFKQDGKPA